MLLASASKYIRKFACRKRKEEEILENTIKILIKIPMIGRNNARDEQKGARKYKGKI